MILRRLGNKTRIAEKIIKHFPNHEMYIEPFFGAGGIFFNKSKANYNILNDLDSDVFNLFQIVSNQKNELEKAFFNVPIHTDLMKYWQLNEEIEPIQKAIRFLMLSNFSFIGAGSMMQLSFANHKKVFYENLERTNKMLFDVQFANFDFRKFLTSIHFRHGDADKKRAFIYADPPYLNTNDNYSHSFTEQDSIDLLNSLQETGCKFAMSEFDNEFILQQAKERKLNIIYIGERQNLKNRRNEILITNYQVAKSLFDDCN